MNLRKRYANTVQVAPLIIALILALAIGGGYVAVSQSGYKVTPAQIYAAENAYALALTAADGYVNSCRAAGSPASCRGIALTIQADVKDTDKAYQKVKGYETNPPTGAGAQFIAALAVLQAAVGV